MGTIGDGWWQVAGAIGSAVVGLSWATVGLAQIVPDGTLPVNSSVVPGCTSCVIEGGTERGVNLYHSFREFSIPTGGSAWFNNSPQIQAILTRVTGSSLSNIDGLIKVNGNANLFFLNPNGILFGPNARLEVGGSFVASTASSWRLPDGSEFSAIAPNEPPLLTVNVPIGLQPGRIPTGSTITNRGNLRTGQDLVLVGDRLDLRGQLQAGRDLTLQANDTVQIRDSITEPFVAKAGGNLLVQGNQSVDIFALNHPNSELLSGGEMVLRSRPSPSSSLNSIIGDTHYFSSGNFRVETLDGHLGNLTSIKDPLIRSLGNVSFNAYQGTSLHILAAGKVEIPTLIQITGSDLANGLVETVVLSDSLFVPIDGRIEPTLDIRAGVSAATIISPGIAGIGTFIPDPSLTITPTSADIQLGNIVFSDISFTTPLTGRVLLTNQYQPNAALRGDIRLSDSIGGKLLDVGNASQGGNVTIDSRGNITLGGNIDASARTLPSGTFSGNGGEVRVLAAGNITLTPGSSISSFGFLGGDIVLTSGSSLSMTNSLISSNSIATSSSGLRGGDIKVTANSILMTNAGLSTSTFGKANAGNIIITARDGVIITGTDGAKSGIQSNVEAGAVANGGDVNITAQSLKLSGAQIQTLVRRAIEATPGTITPAGQGRAGSIDLNIRDDIILNGINAGNGQFYLSLIASSLDFGATGKAGDITVQQAGSLSLSDGAVLNSSTSGQGNAGLVHMNVQGAIRLDGVRRTPLGAVNSGIQSNVEFGAVGNGGNITINAESLSLTNGAQIQTFVRRPFFASNGMILVPAGQGKAGDVQVNVGNAVILDGTNLVTFNGVSTAFSSAINTTLDLGATGQAGNISLRAGSLSITGGANLVSSTAGRGNAGTIRIDVQDKIRIGGISKGSSSGIFSTIEAGGVGTNRRDINIRAGNLSLTDGAQIQTVVRQPLFASDGTILVSGGQGRAGDIQIYLRDQLRLDGVSPTLLQADGTRTAFPSQISSSLLWGGVGQAGNIQVRAGALTVTNGARFRSDTSGRGNAGSIWLTIRDSARFDGFGVISDRNGQPVPSFLSGAFSTVEAGGIGHGGAINLKAGSLSLTNGAQLQTLVRQASGVLPAGKGDAGDVKINVRDTISLSNFSSIISGIDSGTHGTGGNINIQTAFLALKNFSNINSSTYGQGRAGNISIQVSDAIFLDNQSQIAALVGQGGRGKAGDIDIESGTLTVKSGAQISSALFRRQQNVPGGQGRGGNIHITANSITLSGSSVFGFSSGIIALSERGALGDAGNILINADFLHITDGALIVASTFNSGNGGNVTINVNDLELLTGGQIVTNTRGNGQSGNLNLSVVNSLLLEGIDPSFDDRIHRINQYLQLPGQTDRFDDVVVNLGSASGLFANTTSSSKGKGGNVLVDARIINIRDGAKVAVDSQGQGIGGKIAIQAGQLELHNQGFITAETASTQGGSISLNVRDLLLLRRHSLISATAGTAQAGGDGGNITITAPFIIGVLGENSDITANAFTGRGGNINITSNAIYGLQFQPQLTPFSDITASSQFGLSGTVTLNLLDVDPSRGFISLPVDLTDPTTQLDTRCQPGSRGYASSYIETGRGGVPRDPEEPLIDETVTVGWAEVRTERRTEEGGRGTERRMEEGGRRTDEQKLEDSRQTKSPDEIIEAQAIGRDRQGHLWLVAETNQPKRFVPPECRGVGK